MHDTVSTIETINGHVKAQYKNPRIAAPATRVDEFGEDKFRVGLGRHD